MFLLGIIAVEMTEMEGADVSGGLIKWSREFRLWNVSPATHASGSPIGTVRTGIKAIQVWINRYECGRQQSKKIHPGESMLMQYLFL